MDCLKCIIYEICSLCSKSTPKEYLGFLDKRFTGYKIAGYDQVDLQGVGKIKH